MRLATTDIPNDDGVGTIRRLIKEACYGFNKHTGLYAA